MTSHCVYESCCAAVGMASDEKTVQLQAAFAKFDSDGSGFISREEMREAVKAVCEGLGISEEVAIKEADVSAYNGYTCRLYYYCHGLYISL